MLRQRSVGHSGHMSDDLRGLIDALSWGGNPMVSLFLVSDGPEKPDLDLGSLNRSVNRVRTYDLEDEVLTAGGLKTFEYDIEFSQLPEDLPEALRNVLLAPPEAAVRVAWLGFEGSFSFDHLLTEDVAEQIYGLRVPGEAPLLRLDGKARAQPRWKSEVGRTRQLVV